MMNHSSTTINTASISMSAQNMNSMNSGMGVDEMSDPPSSPESDFDTMDIQHHSMHDDVTAQLAAAGPIGLAAAACIATGRKRKRPHVFETNPSIRKRQQTRLLRKLKATIEEYTTRVGQQAVILCCTPGRPAQSPQAFKVIGAQPLENVIRNNRPTILQELEQALQTQTPANAADSGLHELPPLNIDGIPTPVDKMTQAQLRAFIPEMLKYSTGRSKPAWGKAESRPAWWPLDVPWANVRSDVRSDDQKRKVSWTHALRTIVKNCYKHHGRDDLLPEFHEAESHHQYNGTHTMVQTINNPDGTLSIIQIDSSAAPNIVTLPDGSQATVVHTIPAGPGAEATQAVQTLADVATNQHAVPFHVEMKDGQIVHQDGNQFVIATSDGIGSGDGHGIMSIPVSMYQTVVANINQLNEAHQQPIHVAMVPTTSEQQQTSSQSDTSTESVPDATQAVEVMTVDTGVSS